MMINNTDAKGLLVLGTASHVGKSAIVTALCRILSRGYAVAPFKAQNMSLNSWITVDGKEIGIAQAIQAMAAGVEPTAQMNPVLLKPKGDRTSQVIIMGEPYADKSAGEYYESIEDTHGVLKDALASLAAEYEIIVMEGAGGAAEINLYDRDIVNLGTARITGVPIILVGDIERGGVFASLYGTVELLPEDVRSNICGFIINKFRGDPAILGSGLKELEDKTGIPVLGVLPYFKMRIPSEDSVSIADKSDSAAENIYDVNITVIRLPRISNFTDFEPLERMAHVRYADLDEDIEGCDVLIIPGTKNTTGDLKALKESGMDKRIVDLYGRVPILGICGGYQMLGKTIKDSGIEDGESATFEGLGLLDIDTIFEAYEKRTVQVEKTVNGGGPILDPIKGEKITGYEIHMGLSTSRTPVFSDDGCVDDSGLVMGTYLHGLFENVSIRHALICYVLNNKGLDFEGEDIPEQDSYDELADVFRENIDMEQIYRILDVNPSRL